MGSLLTLLRKRDAWNPSLLAGHIATVPFALSRSLGVLWQDAGKTTQATAAGHRIRVFQCPFTGFEFTTPSDDARFTLRNPAGDIWYAEVDGSDDCADFDPLDSKPLSTHFAVQVANVAASMTIICGTAGAQKFKISDNTKMQGGKEGAFNWGASGTVLTNDTDYVGGLSYGTTGEARNYLDGADDGQATDDVAGAPGAFTEPVTRIGARVDGADERFAGRLYAFSIIAGSLSAFNNYRVQAYLAAFQGRTI